MREKLLQLQVWFESLSDRNQCFIEYTVLAIVIPPVLIWLLDLATRHINIICATMVC